ncbi:MAG TPA: response regulator [Kofleriaceae bacterium]
MGGDRMVLRAELGQREQTVIAHTTALSVESVVVRTDADLQIGDVVDLRLSLRRLLPPIALEARVVAKDLGAGHGYFPGVTLAIEPASQGLGRLREVLGRPVTAGASRSILVVEDSALMRDFMQAGAERVSEGEVRFTVDTVESAEAALTRLAEREYDLALVDLYLPTAMSGADLVRTVRAGGGDVAMIGFSIGGPAARDAFLDAGADVFLDKPVNMKDVFATLGRLTPTSKEV